MTALSLKFWLSFFEAVSSLSSMDLRPMSCIGLVNHGVFQYEASELSDVTPYEKVHNSSTVQVCLEVHLTHILCLLKALIAELILISLLFEMRLAKGYGRFCEIMEHCLILNALLVCFNQE
jgi:hypothetical protein